MFCPIFSNPTSPLRFVPSSSRPRSPMRRTTSHFLPCLSCRPNKHQYTWDVPALFLVEIYAREKINEKKNSFSFLIFYFYFSKSPENEGNHRTPIPFPLILCYNYGMENIDARDSEIIRMYVEEGLSTPEIGRRLGLTDGVVYYRLKRNDIPTRRRWGASEKICSQCQRRLPIEDFAGGHVCKECRTSYRRNHTEIPYSKYGITRDVYFHLLEAQGWQCAICGTPHVDENNKRLVIDHDHDTGEVRGLLCSRCNSTVGYTENDVDPARFFAYLHQASW